MLEHGQLRTQAEVQSCGQTSNCGNYSIHRQGSAGVRMDESADRSLELREPEDKGVVSPGYPQLGVAGISKTDRVSRHTGSRRAPMSPRPGKPFRSLASL